MENNVSHSSLMVDIRILPLSICISFLNLCQLKAWFQ